MYLITCTSYNNTPYHLLPAGIVVVYIENLHGNDVVLFVVLHEMPIGVDHRFGVVEPAKYKFYNK